VVVEFDGTTTVVFSGGGGLLLLMQPDRNGTNSARLVSNFIAFPSIACFLSARGILLRTPRALQWHLSTVVVGQRLRQQRCKLRRRHSDARRRGSGADSQRIVVGVTRPSQIVWVVTIDLIQQGQHLRQL